MKISGIGTDIVDISRIKDRISNLKFIDLVFTDDEIKYCQSKKRPEESFAARFAAKEAFMKAIGTGWSNEADFKEIEIMNDLSGQPKVTLTGASLAHFEKSSMNNIFVSLSHSKQSAIAFIVIS